MNISKTHMNISMSRVLKLILSLAILLGAACALWAQTPTPAAQIAGVIGEVKNIDMATNQMIVRAESGVLSTVILNEKTQYKRMAPGTKSLTGATDIALSDVGPGDRVWARWRPGTDQQTVAAAQLVVMSKADLAKKQEAERNEWRKRGVGGMGPGGPGGGQGAGQGRPQAQGQGQRPEGAGPGGPQGGGMRMGGGSMADMLEKLPVISINDLKVGDTILMSSLPGADPTQLTAIQLVTGAETLLAMASARPQQGGQARPQGGVDLNGSFGGMFGGVGGP